MTTNVNLCPLPKLQFSQNGVPVAGGLLFTYQAGTMIKVVTYTDATGVTPNTNPIVLNANGECDCWLEQGIAYKLILSPPTDTDPPTNPYWTEDQVPGLLSLATLLNGTNTWTGSNTFTTLSSAGLATLSSGAVASGSVNLTAATTTVSGSAGGTAQPVPRSQADTLYQTAAGPAFSAYASSGTALAANTFTKVALQTKEFDTASAFDNTTNYRFQPLVAGYYNIEGALTFGVGSSYSTGIFNCVIYKNGSIVKNGTFTNGPTLSQSTSVATALTYLNGSTDYVEMWAFSSSALTTSTGLAYSTLSGFLSRPA